MAKKKGWRELPIGVVIAEPGNTSQYKTGDWRTFKPVIDNAKCIKCNICWTYCPDSAIYVTKEEEYKVNLDYCKGCGICAKECPVKCIEMVGEA